MEIKKGGTGWERVTPLEEHPGLSCEIKRLSFVEKLELSDEWSDEEGAIKLVFGSQRGRGVFSKYVRKIVGLKYDGKEINQPDVILGPDMPPDDGILNFLIRCVEKFWNMNFLTEEERKNSDKPSASTGSKAAKKVAKTHSK